MAPATDRKIIRQGRELLRGSRKWVRLNRDLLSPDQIAEIANTTDELDGAVERRAAKDVNAQGEKLEKQINGALPPRKFPGLRENIEVFLVAAIVAMAVRTFFLQPFKIPTGSMQPTLYGIHDEPECNPRPNPIMRLVSLVGFGTTHRATGCTVRGDHIFVDKVSYHFRKPNRGEVVVFETKNIRDMGPSAGKQFYIKRLVGLSGDELRIDPPFLKVNDKTLDEHPAFKRIYSQDNGYHGYVCQPPNSQRPKYLYSPAVTYNVPKNHFFVLGDNTLSSSDGRYWGSVPQENLVGRAILVYWPFSKRLGRID